MNEQQEATEGPPISMRALLEAGVHFGHNASRWNPKMKPYIFGARNGIHIIDLQHTVKLFGKAFQAVIDCTSRGEKVLFVGTKKQAQEIMRDEAERGDQMHVTERWLGGTLTNFKTVKGSLDRLRTIEAMEADGTVNNLTKKENIVLSREKAKLVRALGGIKNMSKLPGLMFVIDPNKEHIAVKEARKLGIKVVAVTDTNCNPEVIDYVIPGNDDAIRAIKLFTARIADAALIGAKVAKERRNKQTRDSGSSHSEKVIHVSSGGDGPRVEISSGGSSLTADSTAEASASPVAPVAPTTPETTAN